MDGNDTQKASKIIPVQQTDSRAPYLSYPL